MSFYFINNLGEKSKSYNNPYDAFESTVSFIYTCFVFDNRVINILDTKMISVKWAVSCSKHVLHIFEEQYPDDKRPRKTIEAASNWIQDSSEKNRKACMDADSYAASYTNIFAYSCYTSYAVCYSAVNTAGYATYAAYNAAESSPNKSLEIKWQRKKLNQIVYEEVLLLFVKSQYQRIDNKLAKREVSLSTSLVRRIPKELLEYIASFLY